MVKRKTESNYQWLGYEKDEISIRTATVWTGFTSLHHQELTRHWLRRRSTGSEAPTMLIGEEINAKTTKLSRNRRETTSFRSFTASPRRFPWCWTLPLQYPNPNRYPTQNGIRAESAMGLDHFEMVHEPNYRNSRFWIFVSFFKYFGKVNLICSWTLMD